jgi:hypothetical protein
VEKQRLQFLRRKQWLYMNFMYLFYILIIGLLILFQAPGWLIYIVIAMLFLSSAVGMLFFRQNHPLLHLFPEMRELARYEQAKLGEAWRRYHMANLLLQLVLGLYSLSQAWVKSHQASFLAGIPLWYLLITAIILVYLGNLNLRFHIRRFDQKPKEELVAFAKDQSLFLTIFVGVMVFFIIGGYFVIYVVFG